MSLDINILVRPRSLKAIHREADIDLSGSIYRDLLAMIGYGDEQYGKYVKLTQKQKKILAGELRKNESASTGHICEAYVFNDDVLFEADW